MIAAYREPDRKLGKELMEKLIDSLGAGASRLPSPSSSRSAGH